MKIGLVCPYNMARGGAVKEIVRDMRNELTAKGHSVRIITGQPRERNGMDTTDVIFVGSATDFRSPTHTTPTFAVSSDQEAVDQMLESERFDILHFHEPWVPVLSRQLLSRSSSVNVATFHAQLPETVMSRTVAKTFTPYLKAVLKELDELTAVSPAAAEYVRTLTNQPVTIIPNGIDLKRFPHTGRRQARSPKTILYIGRLEQRKGVRYLLEAYHLLAQDQEDARLIVAGDGHLREKMEQLVSELRIPNVTFTGYIDDATRLKLLAEADLFCAPSIYGESFGLVLLEAMASGLVTVAGDNPGYSAVMQEIGAISLVNPKDTVEFARRLKLLLNEVPLRTMWQNWAKEYVKQYSYTNVINQYEQLYKTALKRHGHKVAA